MIREKILFCWSGGKDSALALHRLQQKPGIQIAGLLCTLTEGYDRVSMHGVRRSLLEAQAQSLNLPLVKVFIPQNATNEIYEARMKTAYLNFLEQDVRTVAFGDIFLEDLRKYRDDDLAKQGMKGLYPLWKEPGDVLASEFIRLGFKAKLCCVDTNKVPADFAGRDYDETLLRDLPKGVDLCGENGEFHSFVWDGPNFENPIEIKIGELKIDGPFAFRDLLFKN